jgi:hypothetical protein
MKKNYFVNYIIFFSMIAAFIGEINVYQLNNYLEEEILAIAKNIDNYYESANKIYKAEEIKTLMERFKYNYIDFPYNKSNDQIFISGFSHVSGKPLLNISLYISKDEYSIHGITQDLGIPGMA